MKITILAIGKIKEQYMRDAINDYATRLSKYCKLSFTECPEAATVEKEGDALLNHFPQNAFGIALDLKGKLYSSTELAEVFDRETVRGASHFVFVIGGSDGIDRRVVERCSISLCLSKMTFTHQMARLIICEQIYRAMKINNGETYHK